MQSGLPICISHVTILNFAAISQTAAEILHLTVFQNGHSRHLGFSQFKFLMVHALQRPSLRHPANFHQDQSIFVLLRYDAFLIFQHGGRQPSWISKSVIFKICWGPQPRCLRPRLERKVLEAKDLSFETHQNTFRLDINTAALFLTIILWIFIYLLYLFTTTLLQPFYDPLSGTTQMSRYQKDFAEADMMGWQWHQLNHMQAICTSLQKITTPAPHQSDFYGPDGLPDTQLTASKHWRHILKSVTYRKKNKKCKRKRKSQNHVDIKDSTVKSSMIYLFSTVYFISNSMAYVIHALIT